MRTSNPNRFTRGKRGHWGIGLLCLVLAACAPNPSPASVTSSATTAIPLPAQAVPGETVEPVESPPASPELAENVPPAVVTELQPTIVEAPTQTASAIPEFVLDPTGFPTPPSKLPLAEVRILRPGNLSKVTSPFFMETQAIPGANGIVRIELIGEDGQVLNRQVKGFATPKGQRVGINPKITFEISGVSEMARLQVSVEDADHRISALSSVELILLSVGQVELNQVTDLVDPYVILSPKGDVKINGGTVAVNGLIRPVNDKPVILELVDGDGNVLGSRQLSIPIDEDGSHTPFETTIPYTVSDSTSATLVVSQADTRIPGEAAISSVKVELLP